jgi:hypothetical protein
VLLSAFVLYSALNETGSSGGKNLVQSGYLLTGQRAVEVALVLRVASALRSLRAVPQSSSDSHSIVLAHCLITSKPDLKLQVSTKSLRGSLEQKPCEPWPRFGWGLWLFPERFSQKLVTPSIHPAFLERRAPQNGKHDYTCSAVFETIRSAE